MQNKAFTFLSLIPLLLSSCGIKGGDVASYRNAELLLDKETTYDNSFLRGDYEVIDSMIKAGESFIYYLTDATCSSCQAFKPVITDYVKNTRRLIYSLDIKIDKDELVKIGATYSDYFFMDREISVPQVYVYSTIKGSEFVKNTRYENITMFSNAMNEYIHETNVYQSASLASFNRLQEMNKDFYFYIYNRLDSSSLTIFKEEVKPLIDKTKKIFLLVDYQKFSDEDKASLATSLNKDLSTPLAGHFLKNEMTLVEGKEKGLIKTFFNNL